MKMSESATQESIGETAPSMANKRPASLSELRKHIAYGLCDNTQPFKSILDRALQLSREGKQYLDTDLEGSFVAFARAGYLLLVKLPMHPHHHMLLSDEQRRNILQHGRDILRTLVVLKRRLVDLQTEWAIADAYPESPAVDSLPVLSSTNAGIQARLGHVFREKTDYRIEFEQLLEGKVEDTTPRLRPMNISSSEAQTEGDVPKTEGIEFWQPSTRSESPLSRLPPPLSPYCPGTSHPTTGGGKSSNHFISGLEKLNSLQSGPEAFPLIVRQPVMIKETRHRGECRGLSHWYADHRLHLPFRQVRVRLSICLDV
ncbi:hypothetical protein M413DRAFT_292628 [Hebeloma cylindrosporum]|uniref:USP8 dimerisation domain-containing protein n=1 Tax=Hebeloma cylindrosporum TaxID=76867 RepID=A0A0C2Y5R0_HEBCY|nr:hypothetical protein M413DRAFT_292628 [Hebeloma cylindrosporum h7]